MGSLLKNMADPRFKGQLTAILKKTKLEDGPEARAPGHFDCLASKAGGGWYWEPC
ncbi:MAG: hypothetical protein KDD27_27595 [Saprospiraceae bacterium]|nr:hypothetical protein [Saprospiraceae bacterium]